MTKAETQLSEASLRESNAQLDLALRSANMGVWHWDVIENRRGYDDRSCRLLGIDPATFTGAAEEFFGVVHPDDLEALKAALTRTVEQDVPFEMEYRLAHPDGSTHYICSRGRLARDDNGQPKRINGVLWDITESKQAQEAFASKELFLSSIYENVGAAIFVVDVSTFGEFQFMGWNHTGETITGIKSDQVVGRTPEEIFGPIEGRRICEHYTKCVTEGIQEYEECFPSGTGVRWSRTKLTPVKDDAGRTYQIIGFAADITERKQMEMNLQENEYHLRQAQSTAHIGSWDYDPGTDKLVWSEELYRIYGIIPETFTPSVETLVNLIHPDDQPAMQAWIADCASGQKPKALEFRCVWPDGSLHYIEGQGELILDAEGKPCHMVGTAQDITGRRQAENAIQESEKRFRALIEGVSDVIVVLDPRGQITYASPSVTRTLGYEPVELVGTLIDQYLHPDDLTTAHADLAQIVQTPGAFQQAELRYRHKNGSWVTAETLAKNALDVPLIGGIIVSARDITGRKRSEQTILKVNRALKALSQCNEILVHAPDENRLLRDMCHAIVSTGGYLLAWIGYTEDDAGKTVRPMAYAGYKPGYMEQANITWADVELGQGPVGRAIRSGTPQIVQDALSDPSYKPWRQNAEKIGYRALIALPLSSSGTILGVLSIYSAETNAFDEEEIKLLKELAEDIAFGIVTLRTRTERDRIAHEQLHHVEILRQSLEDALKAIADTVVARDPYTAGHQTRVGQLAVAIAREMGLPEETIHGIGLAASVHDLGKISVPAEILSKPGRLTDIEYMLVKTHVQSGYDILKDIRFPWPIAIMVWQHHERMDGSGYPQGLKGDEIMLESRILAVADVVEAMASHRPYRPALGIEAALGEIERGRGSVYDATVVDACLKVFREGRFTL